MMPMVHAIKPEPGVAGFLAGADFIDAYQVKCADAGLDATTAAQLMFARPPEWITQLLALRNALMRPFGLKTGQETYDNVRKIGIFPVESANPDRAVLGFDDKHLDFRVVVDVARTRDASEVTATTLVRLNNRLGRLYLTAILPFHKLVVRSLLKRVAAIQQGR
jgi:hypothetical protein